MQFSVLFTRDVLTLMLVRFMDENYRTGFQSHCKVTSEKKGNVSISNYRCSMPFCMSRNMAASGAGYRRDPVIGTRFTRVLTAGRSGVSWIMSSLHCRRMTALTFRSIMFRSLAPQSRSIPMGRGLKKRSTIYW